MLIFRSGSYQWHFGLDPDPDTSHKKSRIPESEPETYLLLMDPDPDPGGQKHLDPVEMRIRIPIQKTDISHGYLHFFQKYVLIRI